MGWFRVKLSKMFEIIACYPLSKVSCLFRRGVLLRGLRDSIWLAEVSLFLIGLFDFMIRLGLEFCDRSAFSLLELILDLKGDTEVRFLLYLGHPLLHCSCEGLAAFMVRRATFFISSPQLAYIYAAYFSDGFCREGILMFWWARSCSIFSRMMAYVSGGS